MPGSLAGRGERQPACGVRRVRIRIQHPPFRGSLLSEDGSFLHEGTREGKGMTLTTGSQTGAGVLGNFFILCHCAFVFLTGRRLRTTDSILFHLVLANAIGLVSKGVPQTMVSLGLKIFLDRIGCRLIVFFHRVARSLSVTVTCLLSGFQIITISPFTCSIWHHQQVQHIHRSSLLSRRSPETRATYTILVLMSTYVSFYSITSFFSFYHVHFDKYSQWLLPTSTLLDSCFPAISPFVLISSFDFYSYKQISLRTYHHTK
ncbi:vomeronasal type-1 receptor 1-like [Antechinus flavipes]|uniref:vomeronasal type-1 receptor 1-like n=1 Tax=Antechinus flavipes TaxID=38775 RepID=UPI00223671C3|nr:vomeronasal type-1 receptor 1-like [Antechinus flavipes]